MSLSSNISEKAALIWAIADKLTGVYKPHEYGEVILPLTVIRRFDCILADTKDVVLDKYESVKALPMKDILLRKASGHAFYNTSKYNFEKLLDDPDNIEANFRDYLNGFSENVQDIIEKFKFDGHITTMANKGILYIVIKEFTSPKANLHPDVISNLEMGYIFEEIIRRFSEAHNEDAGQHYTPREVIRLMVNILFYFLMTAISKMKEPKDGGSRIAIIHNGSPLFTGDAGSGPSEIRKYIIENDMLESIIALPNDIFYNTGIATYIWVLSNKKAGTKREGKVQLINANGLFEKRRKALGNKRNDISESAIAEITQIYGDFCTNEISQIYNNEDFGYTKIIVERPLRDENGEILLKNGKKQPDTSLRDTENVPLTEDIKEYFKGEVLPFAPDAWIDEKKSKVGYEIPFTRYFYKYEAPRPSSEIMKEIMELEKELDGALAEVFE